ncbi:MAG: Fic family protein, partial [Actinomycetota bacterium]
MDIEKFKKSSIGDLEHIQGQDAFGRDYDHFAYVPHPLPSQITLKDSTWRLLADAMLQLGMLGGEGNRLPNPALIARPIIRAEAVSSSALEGTYTTLRQVLQSELFQESPSAEVTEVLDQIRAFELGVALMADGKPLGVNLIKHLHGILMQNDARCPAGDKGEFRKRQNFIGPHPRARIEESFFVPPPPEYVVDSIHEWETWMHDPSAAHVLVRAAVAHYQFETIH